MATGWFGDDDDDDANKEEVEEEGGEEENREPRQEVVCQVTSHDVQSSNQGRLAHTKKCVLSIRHYWDRGIAYK